MKIQKYMSQVWICSRRKAEEYVKKGLLKVNWEIAHIWQIVDSKVDKIEIVDKVLEDNKNLVYYKINKPRGIITTCAQYGEKNIIDIVDIKQRVFPIWRLDKETSGLIILTNDWRLANYLMHPKYEHEKEYVVQTFGPIDDFSLDSMRKWLFILWSKTKKAEVKRISSWKFSIILKEWRNRQIRRMVKKLWFDVKRLKRVRIENIKIWNLKYWEYKKLSKKELDELLKILEKNWMWI